MSTPAGWYDDGSGRQRWWDGVRWTEHYAPEQAMPAGQAATPQTMPASQAYEIVASGPMLYGAPASHSHVTPPARPSTLGFVGLGLAVLGTILVCIPTFATVIIGGVVLLAALVISMIAVFKKHTKKWPSIVGIVLSVVGGIIGAIMFGVVLFASLVITAGQHLPTDAPITTPVPSPEVSEPAVEAPEPDARPASEELAAGVRMLLLDGGVTSYEDVPGFYDCAGQFFYDSTLSDEALQNVAAGVDIVDEERQLAIDTAAEATLACDPDGLGL